MTRVGWLTAGLVSALSGTAVAAPLANTTTTTKAKATPGWLDAPAWPPGDTLELTWLVFPIADASVPETTKAPLELVATIGSTSRHLKLKPQFGALSALNQSVCEHKLTNAHALTVAYPLEGKEVAKITFYEGGAGGYLVRRSAPDVLAVVAWELTDGACPDAHGEPGPCPQDEKPTIKLHIPRAVKLHQSLFEVDAKGARHAFSCKIP